MKVSKDTYLETVGNLQSWNLFCQVLLEILDITVTYWILFSPTNYFLLRTVISYSEIVSVSSFPIASKIQIFHRNFFHRILKSTLPFKTTYPNNYVTFQSFHWFSSRSRCRSWNLFHVINYAPNEVVIEKRKGRRSGSSFTIDFLSFIVIYHSYPLYRYCICGSDKKSLKKKKKAADEIEIIPWEYRIPPGHQLKFGWEF